MKKKAANTFMALVLTSTMVLLLSSCSYFRSVGSYFFPPEQGAVSSLGTIARSAKDSKSHYTMGCVFQQRKMHRLAVEEFKLAIAADPGNVAAYNAMGVSMDALGDHDSAAAAYQAALKVDPKAGYALNNLGYCYLLEGKPVPAIQCFKKAVSLDGKNQRYQNNLGLAYARAGKYDAALQAFRAGDGELKAQLNIARLYYQNGLYAQARSHFALAAALKPSDPDIDNGLVAATSLSEIHAVKKMTPENKNLTVAGNEKIDRYDSGGFYTIPARAIKYYKIAETPLVELAKVKRDHSIHKAVPVFTVASVRMANTKAAESVSTVLKTESLQNLDESQPKRQLNFHKTASFSRHRIKIEVSNGNGVTRMARRVGDFLKTKGFILMYLSNAKNFNYRQTTIYYTPGHLRDASRIARVLPGRQNMEEVPIIRRGNADISVRIGKELTAYLNMFQKA